MESVVQPRISACLTEAGDCYLKGMYDKCVQTFQLLCEEAKATPSLLEVCSVDKPVFCCVIENNILVSKGLVGIHCGVYYSIIIGRVVPFFSMFESAPEMQLELRCHLTGTMIATVCFIQKFM
jgi:hypothetical protein